MAYVDHCAKIILALIKNNKKILAVAALKDLLTTIFNRTKELLINDNIDTNKIDLIHGTSDTKLEKIKSFNDSDIANFNCIFSTNKFFSEGLSINWLDTIVYFTSPSSKSLSSIPQLVGRIVRDYKGKRFVNVFDIYNDVFLIEMNRKKSRIKAYSDLKYSILNEISITSDCEKYIEYILKISEENTAQNNNDALIKLNLLN